MIPIEELYYLLGRIEGLLLKNSVRPEELRFIEELRDRNPLFYLSKDEDMLNIKVGTPFNNYDYDDNSFCNNRYYNDSLDMDQQGMDFWDSIS
ncbi:MAG: hypothetical protein JW870_07800 [Candidatus Delongbacteria bacterium]|nr:hypothetical protein [Candidatus Delongbacteria bacterium]